MYIKVSQQDGNLATATKATLNWKTAQFPLQNDVIYKVESDISIANGQIFAATSEARGITWKSYFYNVDTQTWDLKNGPGSVEYDDLMGLNIIRISGKAIYICTDDQIQYIPDYLTKPSIRYRVNESVTVNNITGFNHYKQEEGSLAASVAQVLICPYYGWAGNGTGDDLFQYITANKNDNTNKVYFGHRDMHLDGRYNFIKTLGSKDVAVSMMLNDTGYIEADLSSRVSQLEYEVSSLKERVSACEKVIGDLPAITAALQDNVTKFYVSR